MTIDQFVKQIYKETKAEFEELQSNVDEALYDELRLHLFVETTKAISRLLHDRSDEEALKSWKRALELLLINCRVYKVIPRTEPIEQGYGFPEADYHREDQIIMCFLEGYLVCQTPKLDVIGWIELGQKLELISFDGR